MIPSALLLLILVCISYISAQDVQLPCRKWAFSTAFGSSPSNSASNSSLWLSGGRQRTSAGQTSGTWTSNLLYLDLASDWTTASPSLYQVSTSGVPALALGGLYPSNNGSYIYSFGGQASDTPVATPSQSQLYIYDVADDSWSSSSSDGLMRPAEGAASVISRDATNQEPLAMFGFGHIDYLTDPDWSIDTARVILNSMVSIDLANLAFANITQGPGKRADNTLSFIPYAGTNQEGLLVSIGGYDGSNLISTDNLDVYDIGSNSWSSESTTGTSPSQRMNHCAAEGRVYVNGAWQYQIFVFGGQNLDQSTQYNDVWVLLLPAYEWQLMSTSGTSPSSRAAPTCNFVGSQLIVMGGYVQNVDSCDTSPVSVLDVENMAWVDSYDSSATVYNSPKALSSSIIGNSGNSNSGNGNSNTNTIAGSSGRNRYEPADGSSGNPVTGSSTTTTSATDPATSTRKSGASQKLANGNSIGSTIQDASNPTSTTTSTTSPFSSKPSLIGIIFSVLGFVFVSAAVIICLLRRRKRNKQSRYGQLRDETSEIDSIFGASEDHYSDPFLPHDGQSSWLRRTNVPLNRFALDSRSQFSMDVQEEEEDNPFADPVVIPATPRSEQYVSSTEEGSNSRPSLRLRRSHEDREDEGNVGGGLSANNSISERRTVSSFGGKVEDMSYQQDAEGVGRLAKRDRLYIANS